MKPFLLALSLVSAVACHAPVTITTPAGQAAYRADQIVMRVNELQNAAIAANSASPKQLPDQTTRVIVQFCLSADQTLAATPNGWQATLKASWAATKAQLPVINNPAVVAAMSAVDVVIGGIQ